MFWNYEFLYWVFSHIYVCFLGNFFQTRTFGANFTSRFLSLSISSRYAVGQETDNELDTPLLYQTNFACNPLYTMLAS